MLFVGRNNPAGKATPPCGWSGEVSMTAASDYYEVLQVSPNADEEVIQAAYRRLTMKWHPDRNPGDPFAVSQMKLLNEAYGVLSDPAKRREYDLGRNRAGTSGGTDKDAPKAKP